MAVFYLIFLCFAKYHIIPVNLKRGELKNDEDVFSRIYLKFRKNYVENKIKTFPEILGREDILGDFRSYLEICYDLEIIFLVNAMIVPLDDGENHYDSSKIEEYDVVYKKIRDKETDLGNIIKLYFSNEFEECSTKDYNETWPLVKNYCLELKILIQEIQKNSKYFLDRKKWIAEISLE